MKRTLPISLACLTFSLPVFAMNLPDFYIGAYGGYGNVSGALKRDGQTNQARLTLGMNGAEFRSMIFGGELGIQSGNNMRLQANPALIAASGGGPLDSTLKPIADFLLTVKLRFSDKYPIVGLLKGGAAYRQLQLNDVDSLRDSLRKINPEFQAGIGISVSEHAVISAVYQGIYSGSTASAKLTSTNNVTISHIPTQQSIFIGVDYSFGGTPAPAVSNMRAHPMHSANHQTTLRSTQKVASVTHHAAKATPIKVTMKPNFQHQLETEIKTAVAAQKSTTKKMAELKSSKAKVAHHITKKSTKHALASNSKNQQKTTVARAVSVKKSKPVITANNSKTAQPTTPSVQTSTPATQLEMPKIFSQADNMTIDKPALDLDLISDTEVDQSQSAKSNGPTAVMV